MSLPSGSTSFRLLPILIAQAFGIACGVAGVKLNSELLAPEVLGVYGVFLSLTPLGVWIVHAGVIKFINREWAAAASRPALLRRAVFSWAQRLPWLALLAIPAALALAQLGSASAVSSWFALFPAAPLLVLGALAQAALQAERAHWRDCAVSVTGSTSRTFAPLLGFVIGGGTVQALWAGFGVHALLFAVAGAWVLRPYWKSRGGPSDARPLGRVFAGPLFTLLATAGWVLAGLNRWLVAIFFGETEAGYFTLAGGAAVVIAGTLGSVFIQFSQPDFFALGERPDGHAPLARRVDQAAAAYGLVAMTAIGAFVLAAPALVGPLIDERYRGALPWILPAGCFGVATLTLVFYQSLLLAGRREMACGRVELTSAAVLMLGCVVSAALGTTWFSRWLIITPVIPWLLTRPLARHSLFKPGGVATPAPAPPETSA